MQSDRGLKRKMTGFQNDPSDILVSHYPQESLNLSHEHAWAAHNHYNPHGQRPHLIDSFAGGNLPHHLSSASKGTWRPPLNLQMPSHPFQKQVRSQFDPLNATNLPVNDTVPFSERREPSQQNPGQNRFPLQLSLPQEIRPGMIPPTLGYNPSHLATRPMIRGYTSQRSDSSVGDSLHPVSSMQSSMPFHLGLPPLPPGPPPVPQLSLSISSAPPAGVALSGLFSSLMAQGLLSLNKPPHEQVHITN